MLSSSFLSGMVVPMTWATFFLSMRVVFVCAILSIVGGILSLVQGALPADFIGLVTVLSLVCLLLWKKSKRFHEQLVEFREKQRALQRSLIPLAETRQEKRLAIQTQEAAIQEISELYGLSKMFLATLDLGQALQITEEVLRREFPSMEEKEREPSLQTVRSLVEHGQVTVEALIDAVPSLDKSSHNRDRWGIVGGQFALGLRRISLYRQVQESAIHDGLTALFVRRYLLERLKEEIARASRRENRLAFLMVDLDYFKQINDTYGHLVGDVILREVSQRIRRSVREMDLVGRYGGEEFAVVLPEADRSLGIQIANRIRQTIENVPVSAYDEKIRVTVSIGVSLYPEDAQTADQLIEQADRAMYEAKKAGRNQTVSAA